MLERYVVYASYRIAMINACHVLAARCICVYAIDSDYG